MPPRLRGAHFEVRHVASSMILKTFCPALCVAAGVAAVDVTEGHRF